MNGPVGIQTQGRESGRTLMGFAESGYPGRPNVTPTFEVEECAFHNAATCPDCGGGMFHQGGCFFCPQCGFQSCGM